MLLDAELMNASSEKISKSVSNKISALKAREKKIIEKKFIIKFIQMQEDRFDSFLAFIPKNKETKKECW